MPDQIQLCAYGHLLSGRRDLAIAGDLPDPDRARAVRLKAVRATEATTWSWAGGEFARTGGMNGGVPWGRLSATPISGQDS